MAKCLVIITAVLLSHKCFTLNAAAKPVYNQHEMMDQRAFLGVPVIKPFPLPFFFPAFLTWPFAGLVSPTLTVGNGNGNSNGNSEEVENQPSASQQNPDPLGPNAVILPVAPGGIFLAQKDHDTSTT